tara:strand:- start:537 stop:1373 length:837 start_codon:yes stop_codon:yes gene_type:complete
MKNTKSISNNNSRSTNNNTIGRVVLVTGASGEIGMKISEEFLINGDIVIGQYRKNKKGFDKLTDCYKDFYYFKADLLKKNDIDSLFKFLKKKFGKLNVLVNSAGIISQKIGPIESFSSEQLRYNLEINLVAQFECCKHAYDIMKHENHGMIVNIGSLAGILPNYHNSLYSISKAALEMLTKSMALEWSANNIRVNSVVPAGANSKMAKTLYKTKEKLEARKKAIPLGELVNCRDIAKAALFLASSEIKSISGSSLVLDGGSSISYFRLVDIYSRTLES